jgi:DNA polymerase-3 subunit alpha
VLNRRVLESLACAGAFDSLDQESNRHSWRARLYAIIDAALTYGARAQKDRDSGQNGLFVADVQALHEVSEKHIPLIEAWEHKTLLLHEKNSIGFYITGHPLENFTMILDELKCPNTLNLLALENGIKVQVGGLITTLQIRATKKGDQFALMRLEDQAGGVKCVVWPESFNKNKNLLQDDAAVLITGKLELGDESNATIIVEEVARLENVLQRRAKALVVRLPHNMTSESHLEPIWRLFDRHRGECEVFLELFLDNKVLVRARTHGALRVTGSLELESTLREFGCEVEWMNAMRSDNSQDSLTRTV